MPWTGTGLRRPQPRGLLQCRMRNTRKMARGCSSGIRRLLALGLGLAIALACGLFAETPVRRIRQKVIDSLGNTPDFICSEIIEGTERFGRAETVTLPAIRVTAGVINGQELYVLPANEDDQLRLRQVLAVFAKGGTGSFALYSRAVFLTTDASFSGIVNESKDGISLSHTDFAMPQDGTYALNVGGKRVRFGYTGSIWMEPATFEMVRLALRADDPPAGSDIKSVSQSFVFGHTRFSPHTVLMPVSMEFDLQERSGAQRLLTAHFSDCHQYVSKRGDQFVEAAPGPPIEPAASPPGEVLAPGVTAGARPEGPFLPAKLELQTQLSEAIDERTTVQGTRLSLTVTRDVKEKGNVIVPKGAAIQGVVTRIIRQVYPVEISSGLKAYYLVGIRLDTVNAESGQFQLVGNLESLGPRPGASRMAINNSIYFIPYSSDPDRWGTYDSWRTVFVVPKPDRGESFLGVVGESLRLPGHFVMYWTTVEPPH